MAKIIQLQPIFASNFQRLNDIILNEKTHDGSDVMTYPQYDIS